MSMSFPAITLCAGTKRENTSFLFNFNGTLRLGREIFFTGIFCPLSASNRLDNCVPIGR